MLTRKQPLRVAVIGAGIAGAACAAGLLQSGADVMVFDKSRSAGGRMATRRARWVDGDGVEGSAEFDHGAPQFGAERPRFRAFIGRAVAAGWVMPCDQHVHAAWPAPALRRGFVPVPGMPALSRYGLAGVPLRLGQAVQRLQRGHDGWQLALADGGSAGPFDQVMLALPPAQAALLLAGHHDDWADALAAVPMAPCWTLMAVTDDVDWPWDAAEPERGPLARVARNDRKPGRPLTAGQATWVAHATAAWSAAHLEDEPANVSEALCAALRRQLPRALPDGRPLTWHHTAVHRWRYAVPAQPARGESDCWWDAALGLGVCGDSFGAGTVEAAWCSGDELADTVAAGIDVAETVIAAPPRAVVEAGSLASAPNAQAVH